MTTSIPGLPKDFHAGLPTASQMTVNRPGWPTHINTSAKEVNKP